MDNSDRDCLISSNRLPRHVLPDVDRRRRRRRARSVCAHDDGLAGVFTEAPEALTYLTENEYVPAANPETVTVKVMLELLPDVVQDGDARIISILRPERAANAGGAITVTSGRTAAVIPSPFRTVRRDTPPT